MLNLDVGSGSGASHIARGDINLDIAKPKRYPTNFIQADAHHLPFKNEIFEKIYFYDIIEHVENPSQCLREIKRVLKYKGEVEISTPNPLHWRTFLRATRQKKITLSGKEHIATWTQAEMEILLENIGFKNITISYTILSATTRYDWKHALMDAVGFKLLPSPISGRSMIVKAIKS